MNATTAPTIPLNKASVSRNLEALRYLVLQARQASTEECPTLKGLLFPTYGFEVHNPRTNAAMEVLINYLHISGIKLGFARYVGADLKPVAYNPSKHNLRAPGRGISNLCVL